MYIFFFFGLPGNFLLLQGPLRFQKFTITLLPFLFQLFPRKRNITFIKIRHSTSRITACYLALCRPLTRDRVCYVSKQVYVGCDHWRGHEKLRVFLVYNPIPPPIFIDFVRCFHFNPVLPLIRRRFLRSLPSMTILSRQLSVCS